MIDWKGCRIAEPSRSVGDAPLNPSEMRRQAADQKFRRLPAARLWAHSSTLDEVTLVSTIGRRAK